MNWDKHTCLRCGKDLGAYHRRCDKCLTWCYWTDGILTAYAKGSEGDVTRTREPLPWVHIPVGCLFVASWEPVKTQERCWMFRK